jgi:hypothetical protein
MIRSATAAACSRAEQPLSRVGQEGRALPTNGQTFCGCVGARRPFIKTMHRMCVFDNGDNRTDLFVRSVRSDKLSVQERCMVRHALTGNIFAIGCTRSTCSTLYGRIGDIVPAWRQSDRPFREVRQVRQVICPGAMQGRDNRTDVLRQKSKTRHRSIGARDANLVVHADREEVCPVVCPVLISGQTFCRYPGDDLPSKRCTKCPCS